MGNLKSCCLQICPPSKEEDPYGERARILSDPTEGRLSEDNYQISSSNERIYGTMDYGSKNSQTNNKWNRTLQKMTVNVIDVSTTYVPAMEQSELLERQKAYTNKINSSRLTFLLKNKQNRVKRLQRKSNLDAKKLQVTESINVEDIIFMNQLSEKLADAVNRGFQIDIKEELVVQFNP